MTTTTMQSAILADRYKRSSSIIPQKSLGDILIIGCGAVGRQLAIQLSTMGCNSILLIDYDKVEPVNLGSQAFLESNVGSYKTLATKELCTLINSSIKIETAERCYFPEDLLNKKAVFCCLDTMLGRKQIWDDIQEGFHTSCSLKLYTESRMTGELVRILTPHSHTCWAAYEETLFSDEDALDDPCTSRTTIYGATIAASLLASQYTKYLRGHIIEQDFEFNIHGLQLNNAGYLSIKPDSDPIEESTSLLEEVESF